MKKFLTEFKNFAMRGNVLDMAIGVVIGSAFTSIVNSLVGDIFTPLISLLTAGVNFAEMGIPLGRGEGAAVLAYGNFIQAIIEFILIAFCVFCLVKFINRLNRKKLEEEAAAKAAAEAEAANKPTAEQLLAEIRDLLKDNK